MTDGRLATEPCRDSNRNEEQESPIGFPPALPDSSAEDNVGLPYCVRRYVVDQRLGGPAGEFQGHIT